MLAKFTKIIRHYVKNGLDKSENQTVQLAWQSKS
jgi:hypothetical protein